MTFNFPNIFGRREQAHNTTQDSGSAARARSVAERLLNDIRSGNYYSYRTETRIDPVPSTPIAGTADNVYYTYLRLATDSGNVPYMSANDAIKLFKHIVNLTEEVKGKMNVDDLIMCIRKAVYAEMDTDTINDHRQVDIDIEL